MLESIYSHFIFSFVYPGIILGIFLIVISYFIPIILEQYKLLVRTFGYVLLIFFVFQDGRMSESSKYEKQIAIAEKRITEMEKQSALVQTQIVTEYVDKIKYVHRIKEIKTNVYIKEKDDSACVISLDASNDIRMLINSASQGRLPDAPTPVDAKTN